MALPESGRLALSDIAAEFGGESPHKLSEYVAEGGNRMSGFYGLSSFVATQTNKFSPSNLSVGDYFGSSGSINEDGTVAVICSPRAYREGRKDNGRAYIFTKVGSDWIEQEMNPNKPYTFGKSGWVNAQGTKAIISGYNELHFYSRTGNVWREEYTFKLSIGSGNISYVSMSVAEDTLVVSGNGKTFVYLGQSGVWDLIQTIVGFEPSSLSKDGDVLALGSRYYRTVDGVYYGEVHVYVKENNQFVQTAAIQPPLQEIDQARFGEFVDVSSDGTYLLIGSASRNKVGTAYVYERVNSESNVWTLVADLPPSNPSNVYQVYGARGAISDDGSRVVVSGYRTSNQASQEGAVFVFEREGSHWNEKKVVYAGDPSYYAFFGSSVSLNGVGTKLLCGASNKKYSGTGVEHIEGASYLFDLESAS